MIKIAKINQAKKGFTLVEILLVLAIITILAGVTAPFYSELMNRNELDVAIQATSGSLKRAQVLSQAMTYDDGWGVKIESGAVTLFKGNSFATRDTAFDEVVNISTNLTILNDSEFTFDKFTGLPQVTGTVTIETTSGEQRGVQVNSKGRVDY